MKSTWDGCSRRDREEMRQLKDLEAHRKYRKHPHKFSFKNGNEPELKIKKWWHIFAFMYGETRSPRESHVRLLHPVATLLWGNSIITIDTYICNDVQKNSRRSHRIFSHARKWNMRGGPVIHSRYGHCCYIHINARMSVHVPVNNHESRFYAPSPLW